MATINENNNDASAGVETQYKISLGDTFQGTLATADDVDWVRVELTVGTIYDISQTDGEDVSLSLLNSEGNHIINGSSRPAGEKIILSPDESGTYYIGIERNDDVTGEYEISLVENTIPIGTYDELADYLTHGYKEGLGGTPAKIDIKSGGVLTVNITALNEDGQQLARWAFEAWTYVTGIEFELVEGDSALITFDDDDEGAYASNVTNNGIITSAHVNVSEQRLIDGGTTIGSYSLGTYIHEIGHALGLGHLKPDTYSTTFGVGEEFLLNSYQASNMSGYFQDRNTFINASPARPVTPMIADIIAIQNLYGVPEDSNSGDTIYGYQSNVDGYLGEFFEVWTGENNPFILISPQDYAGFDNSTIMTSGDLDGDGDLDLVTGSPNGAFHYFENTGAATAPAFTKRSGATNPLDSVNVGNYNSPALIDLDGDGDLDLIAGSDRGTIAYFENTGTSANPVFTERSGALNPLDSVNVGTFSSPALADFDDDGDPDLIVGNEDGNIAYFENTGTATTASFTQRTSTNNPLDSVDVGISSSPELTDLDGDGDVDLVVWGWYGAITYFENTGAATAPVFTEFTGADMPLDIIAVSYAPPVLADLDGDGDPDIVAAHYSGALRYFENDGTNTEPDFVAPNIEYPNALTLYDTGGADTLDLRTDRDDQRIDLRPEGISDVYGLTGNLVIARDVLIENVVAGHGNDVVIGNTAVNRLEGRAGDDVLEGGAGADTLDGGPGNDTAAYTESNAGVAVRLLTGAGQRGHAEGDTLTAIENITGSAHRDYLGGDAGANILNGGPGDDGLRGSAGDDVLEGGAGADTLDGGPGDDYAYYLDSAVGVLVRLHNANAVKYGEAEGDTLTGIEHLVGSNHNDVLAGDGEDNLLDGGDGDDVLYGGPAGGDDEMYGGNGDDRIFGGKGNDILTGGEGNDLLKGGPGEDTFIIVIIPLTQQNKSPIIVSTALGDYRKCVQLLNSLSNILLTKPVLKAL